MVVEFYVYLLSFQRVKHVSRAHVSNAYFIRVSWIIQKFAHQNLAPGLALQPSAGDIL